MKRDLFAVPEIAGPAVLEDPGIHWIFPSCTLRKDVALQAKRVRFELVYIQINHHTFDPIEVLVVVDSRGAGAEDPFAVWPEISLGRPTFYLRTNRVLNFVGVRDDVVVERKKAQTQRHACDEHRNGKTV